MATSTIHASDTLPIQGITVTASTNVVIDTNKSFRRGKYAVLAVKGHATAAISNAYLFTFNVGTDVSVWEYNFTFPIGIGAQWSITETGYAYMGANSVTGTVASGKYFHIYIPLILN